MIAAAPALLLMARFAMSRPRTRERPRDVETDDALLVARAARGEPGAFEELHVRHVDMVWRRLTHLIGADPEREDLTQQIFMEVFHGLARFRGEATFRTYLQRVVVHAACDHLERRRRRPEPLSEEMSRVMVAAGGSPEQSAEQRQLVQLTWTALERIKPKKRVAFILRVVEEMSLEEVAELVGATVSTVAKRIAHAHAELQKMLGRRLKDGPVVGVAAAARKDART